MAPLLPRHQRILSTTWLESSLLMTLSLSCEQHCCTPYIMQLALIAGSSDTSLGCEPAFRAYLLPGLRSSSSLQWQSVSHKRAACRDDP